MIRICCILLACVMFSGCMESRELKERCIIEAVGIDREEKSYNLIFQQFEASEKGENGENSGKSSAIKCEGRSISEAIDKVTHYNGNEVFLGNSTYIVFGEEMANAGILQELNYFNGENEISPSIMMVVSEGKAAKMIEEQSKNSNQNNSAIRQILEQGQKNGIVGKSTMLNVIKRLEGGFSSPFLPQISVEGEGEDAKFKISGMAIFSKDKLVDVIDTELAKGVLLINNEIERALFVVENGNLGIISAEFEKNKSKVKCEVKNAIPKFTLEIKCSGRIKEVLGKNSGTLDNDEQKQAESLYEAKIKELVESAIERCFFEDGSDIFRFGEKLKQSYPEYWKQIEDNWNEEMKNCEIEIKVDCKLEKKNQQAIY